MTGQTQRLAAGFAGVISLAGCMVGPDYVKPAAEVPAAFKELPAQKGWHGAAPADAAPKGDWWRVFNDPQLDALEQQVAVSNQSLKVNEANYRQAQALLQQGRAAIFPALSVSASAGRSETAVAIANSGTAEVSSSWTLDLWGKLRRGFEQQGATTAATAADLANARLSLQSSLASAWFNLRQTDALHDLLTRTVAEYGKSLDLAQNQFKAGTAARSDVITAQVQLLGARASLTNTGVARAQYEHAIAVLIGKAPEDLSIPHLTLGHTPPHVPPALPSTLLERRPDIASAERKMQAANAGIGVAIGAYYPSVSLTGSYGVGGNLVSASNPLWSLAGSLTQTLFNAGQTAASVEAARATYDGTVATYRQTVLTAFQQVDDQLSTLRVLAEEAGIQDQSVAASRQAVDIALNEYRAGTQSYSSVVTAQAAALSSEESALATRGARFQATVNLIVALGGGWDPVAAGVYPPPKQP